VLRKISGPEREEVVGDWRKLHNEELHNLDASAYVFRVIKPRRMRMALMGETRNAVFWLEN